MTGELQRNRERLIYRNRDYLRKYCTHCHKRNGIKRRKCVKCGAKPVVWLVNSLDRIRTYQGRF